MSNGLSTTKLENIGSVRMCKRILKSQTSKKAEIPFFKISTFGDKPDTYIEKTLYDEFRKKYSFPKKGDILISAAGTVGKTVIYDGMPAYFQDSNIVWIENDESRLLNSYLYYFYQTKPWQTTNGSTIKRIYNDDLKSIKISFPEIPSQREIASVLSTLDNKIELNNRINSELEAMAKLIYDYWFVQFDFPFDFAQGKPDINGKPYKSSGGKMVWNKELKREIPEGWEVNVLDEILSIQRGVSYTSKNIKDNTGNPLLSLNSFYLDGSYKIDGIKYFSGKYNKSRMIEPGDIIIATTDVTRNADIIGKAFMVPDIFDEEEIYFSMDLAQIVPASQISKHYLRMLFNSDYYHDYIKYFATGTLVLHLNMDGIKWFKIPVPDISLLQQFDNLMDAIESKKSIIMIENQKLAELRDWLLPMLMNGQVSVKA